MTDLREACELKVIPPLALITWGRWTLEIDGRVVPFGQWCSVRPPEAEVVLRGHFASPNLSVRARLRLVADCPSRTRTELRFALGPPPPDWERRAADRLELAPRV